MTDTEMPPPREEVTEPTPEMIQAWRQTAYYTFSVLQGSLDTAHSSVRSAREMADTWPDEQWATCGYEKEATLTLLDSLMKLAGAYTGANGLAGTHDYRADAAALKTQEPAP